MKRLLILFLPLFFLSIQHSARADGVSFGIPLPFPFLFYNFDQGYHAQPAYAQPPYYGGYYRQPYCAPSTRRAYYYGYYRRYYPPMYRSYRPGWYGYGWPRYYGPGFYGYGP